jgi:hypothetical protein
MRISKTNIAAIGSMLIGIVWCLSMLAEQLLRARTQAEIPFGIPIVASLVISIPGLICLVLGFKLQRKTTDANIVRALGAVTFIGALTLPVGYEWISGERFVTKDNFALKTLLLIVVATPVYVLIANNIRRSVGIPVHKLEGLFSKPFIFLIALQVWVAMMDLFQLLEPFEQHENLGYTLTLFLAAIAVPLLTAGFVYDKLCKAAGLIQKPFKHSGPKHA